MNGIQTHCNGLILLAMVAITFASCGRQQGENATAPEPGVTPVLASPRLQADEAVSYVGDTPAETSSQSQPAPADLQAAASKAEAPAQASKMKDGQPESEQTVHEAWVPDYSDETPSVLQIVSGQLRPGIRRKIKKEPASAEVWASVVRQVGDVAWDTGSGDMLIASGRSAVLSETPLDTLADQDLSDKLQNKLIIRRAEGRPGTNVILKTVAGKYALLQIGMVNDRKVQVFWIYQPNGSARFSEAALTALAAARKPLATISVLTDLSSPEGRLLDMSKATLLPSPVKVPEPPESQEDALRAIRKVADLAYWNGRLLAGSEKMAFLGRGQLLDFADKNAAEAVRRRGGPWLVGPKIEPGNVFVVMARDSKYALCRVMAKQGSTITIRWVMQERDKIKFPVHTLDPPVKPTSTLFDKLPKDPTARLQRLVSIPVPGESNDHADRTPILAEIQRMLSAGADPEAFQKPLGYNALQLAANSGAADAVKLLLDAGAKVDSPCRGGSTALHIAAHMNQYEVCRLLLQHGADPQAKDASGATPLAVALQRSPALQSFVGKDRVIPLLTKSGGSPQSLHAAALAGNVDQIKSILAKGANVNQQDSQSKTPLYIAAEQGKADAVALLLDAKGDASIRVPHGQWPWTPLIVAADKGHTEVVQVLLTKATTITAEEKHAALYWAVLKQHIKVCEVLLENGAPYRERMEGDGPSTILEIAWSSPNPKIPALFLTRGEQMPLWAACQLADTKTAQTLLAKPNANPDERSPTGVAPLHIAVRDGHLDLAQMLLDKGANINLPTALTNETVLHLAVEAENLAAVKSLIARHASVNALAMGGRSPLYCAAVLHKNAAIVTALLDAGADTSLVPDSDRQSGKTKLSELTRDKTIQRLLQEHEKTSERK